MKPSSQMARLPPKGLVGLEPSWSRLVSAADQHGTERTWHVLDTGDDGARGTVLCVHGNPNWSYMWRGIARELSNWRVIAVDLLNMGFSERTGKQRRFADHIADLVSLTDALEVRGPVVTVAHDWGGPISMGWAQQHVDQLAGVVLMNTGVARPEGLKVPPLITLARATLRATCETTPTFLHGALRMARPQLRRDVYRSFTAPYRSADRRTGIHDFVEDIPVFEDHPTHEPLAAVAAGLKDLADTPALLLWGAKDLVFSDAFCADLSERLPHADVHRYADAAHQIIEDTDATSVIKNWLETRLETDLETAVDPAAGALAPPPVVEATAKCSRLWSAVAEADDGGAAAVVEMDTKSGSKIARSISFDELDKKISAAAAGLLAAGVQPGHRLATLVPPGIDLIVLIYACFRAGIVVVAPDAALGLDGMRRALRSSRPDFVVGDWRGLGLAKALRLQAQRLSVAPLPVALAKTMRTVGSLDEFVTESGGASPPTEPDRDAPAAIVFTSGSTGPSKGVVYTHAQLEAQRDAVAEAFALEPSDRLAVAFAPFAVLAPAIGIPAVIPNMDVTKPAKLRAQTLGEAAKAIDATILFASPRVLANIAATADAADDRTRSALAQIRSVATAGAPVSPELLNVVQPVFRDATIFTPYGMTEVLPVTVASTIEILAASDEPGVCVGKALPQVDVAICPVDTPKGSMPESLPTGEVGEVWIRAAHGCAGYDRLWEQQRHAFVNGWHRSGDVGHLDGEQRLWIEGRVSHLIHAPTGVLTPVPIELKAESVEGIDCAAAVGIGPTGTQQLAVVVAGPALDKAVVASTDLAAAVRAAVDGEVAAVLVAPEIPVDRRHNSKIDRTRVQAWAEAVLSGASPARL